MGDPEQWRWIWLIAAGLFGVGEMLTVGFFLAPFAVGAVVATLLAFAGAPLVVEWAAFVGVSALAFAGLRPLARRLDQGDSGEGIGAKRLVGQGAVVLDPITEHELGLVRVHREEWRAESVDGTAIEAGRRVKVVEVRGTRVMVSPVDRLGPTTPISEPPAEHQEDNG